jgi:hypothetical protein
MIGGLGREPAWSGRGFARREALGRQCRCVARGVCQSQMATGVNGTREDGFLGCAETRAYCTACAMYFRSLQGVERARRRSVLPHRRRHKSADLAHFHVSSTGAIM